MHYNNNMDKVSYKISCNLTILFNKINITIYFETLTVELQVLYSLNIDQILCQSDIIYYMIYKFIFYA